MPRYLSGCTTRERAGWRWQSGESEARRAPPELEGLELYGLIDRIDRREGKDGPALELIDYKTGSVEKLKENAARTARGHAAGLLCRARRRRARRSPRSYLAVDRTRGLIPIEHARVADDARTLVVGIADEMTRLRAGAGLRALGEGSVCEYCRARGLCRRDHWTSERRWRVTRRRCASTAGASTRRRSTPPPATRRARASSRRAPARARPGCWSRASLRALLDGAPPHEILAITFTREAAGEMRERLDDWLAEFSTPRSTHDAARAARWSSAASTPARAEALAPELGALQGRVLAAGRPVEMRTFHGWFAQLLRSAPLALLDRLGLQADAELVEDWREHRAGGAPRLPRRAAARRRAARRPRRGDGGARPASAARLARRGLGPARRVRARRRGRHARDAASSAAEDCWPELAACAAPGRVDRDAGVDRAAARARARARRGARQAGARRRRRARRRALRSRRRSASPPSRHRSALFTDGRGASRARSPGGLPLAEQAQCELAAAADAGRSARRARRAPAHGPARRARCSPRSPTTSARMASPTWPTSSASRWRCCATASSSGWVQERLDARVRHLLIDEFQDTSPLQWHALHGWLSAMPAPAAARAGSGRRRLHRRRPEAEHLPLPPRRAARVRGGARASCVEGARRQRPRLRPHAAQRAAGDRGDQRACSAPPATLFAGLSRAHTTEVGADAASAVSRRCRASTGRRGRRAARRRRGAARLARQPDRRRGWSSTRCCASARPRRSPRPWCARDRGRHARRRRSTCCCRKRQSLRLVAARARAPARAAIRRSRTPCWPRRPRRRT